MTNKPTADTHDPSDRQNLADTMTAGLPPETRTAPRPPLSELVTPSPRSMERTPITDRYEGALDLMGIPDTESVLVQTPVSAESRPQTDEAWFVPSTTGGGSSRQEAPSQNAPAKVELPNRMPLIVAGTAAILAMMFLVGYLAMG